MSDPHETNEDEQADAAMRDLLKRSLSKEVFERDTPDLLPGVQRRLRKRSRGKFFGDGWSTAQARTSYVLIALATVLLVALAYFALGPMDLH